MSRTLCEWKKHEIAEETVALAKIVRDPRFVCRKCARAAHKDKYLCKPMPLPEEAEVSQHDNDDDDERKSKH